MSLGGVFPYSSLSWYHCDAFPLSLQSIFIPDMKSLSGGGLFVPYSSFKSSYGHLQVGCTVSYGPLYFSLVISDENAFCLTLGIPVFSHTSTQCCCMDSAFFHL